MCEWEVWAPGHPRRDTNMGGAACLSFKHTMQVIQTCRRAHGDSMRPCPRPPPQKQTGRGPGRGMFSPSVHSYLSRTLLSPTPRPSSGRRGCEGVRLRSQPSSGSKCFESKLSACVGPTHTTRAMFFLFFKKKGNILKRIHVCVTQASVVGLQRLLSLDRPGQSPPLWL